MSGPFKGRIGPAKRISGRGCAVRHLVFALAIVAVAGNISLASTKRNTANSSVSVIACDGMTKEDRVEVVTVGTLGVLLAVAAPKFSREVNICLWLAYLAFVYGLAVVKLRRKRWSRMTLTLVLVIGWVLATAASLVAWYGFPPAATASTSELELRFMARAKSMSVIKEGTPQAQDIVHISAELVNRSDKNMSLSFILMIKFPTKNGSFYVMSSEGEWKEKLTAPEFLDIVNLPHQSTVNGDLIFRLISIKHLKESHKEIDFGVDKWADVKGELMVLRIEDKVSGASVLTDSMHYPCGPGVLEKWKKGL